MAPAITAIAAGIVGKKLFEQLAVDVYRYLSGKAGIKIKQWNTTSKRHTLFTKINKVRKVKTIWQVDKTVDLTTFYCDSNVIVDNTRRKITKLQDFGISDNLLISGIAGQGKSIFLRYLCSRELILGHFIPIFLELRRVSKDTSLRDRIYLTFKTLGLTVNDELFDALASSGKILLLLDAFDEIPDNLKPAVLTDIEDLASTNENLRIIVSSRPNNTIEASNYFRVVTLDNLRKREFENVIHKLAGQHEWATKLVGHIDKQASQIKAMLITPLMVTLLVILYKSYQKLPDKLSDFYDALFLILLQRHDGTKPGFTRERGCALDDAQYRDAFETLCIFAKKTGKQTFKYNEIYDVAQKAMEHCDLGVGPQAYLDDIVKITCLIIRDGEEYRYIHKTVHEYYTASYIRKRPELWAKSFYAKLIASGAYREWWEELDFLSEIDQFRYSKYYDLPMILKFLRISESDLDGKPCKMNVRYLRSILKEVRVRIRTSDGPSVKGTSNNHVFPTFS